MNITKQTQEALKEMGYCFHFQDQNINVVDADKAIEMYIVFQKLGENEIQYIGKTIKATKKETTLDYVLDKINADKTFKNFSVEFNKVVSKFGLSAYATTYGIGVFVAIGFRNSINETKEKVERALNEIGVKFTTEYSDAGWVFRYKISKASDNISIIQNYAA